MEKTWKDDKRKEQRVGRYMSKLEADDGVLDEALSKGPSLEGVLHGFFQQDASETNRLHTDRPALMILSEKQVNEKEAINTGKMRERRGEARRARGTYKVVHNIPSENKEKATSERRES
jgi:hypothetical protein